jgi:C-terminal processing protease CtpA/Prc
LKIVTVEPNSPAWNKNIRGGTIILTIDGSPATQQLLYHSFESKNNGDTLKLTVQKGLVKQDVAIVLGTKKEKTFKISPLPKPDSLQAAIYKSWVGN